MWGPWLPILACLNDYEIWRFEDKLVRAYNDAATEAAPVAADPNALNIVSVVVAVIGAMILLSAGAVFVASIRRLNAFASVTLVALATMCLMLSSAMALFGASVVPRFRGSPGPPTKLVPLPHNLGPRPDGLSLRYSLIRDTLHERYDHHGTAYYEARVASAQAVVGDLATLTEPTDEQYAAMDDLSVALDHLERVDEAIAVQQRKLELSGGSYTTYANLGTHMVHRYIGEMMAGDVSARVDVEEGLGYLRRAVKLNPDAHFGREEWQIRMIDGLLRAAGRPGSLTTTTLLGQPLMTVESKTPVSYTHDSYNAYRHDDFQVLQESLLSGEELNTEDRHGLRRYTVPRATYLDAATGEESVPWDEPMLGLIGMWQAGGGPNPHSALCMATGLEEVGEQKLAWAAYERARLMADRFSTRPDIVATLRAHCESRQAVIATALEQTEETLRQEFDAELKLGMDWQAAMADYEAEALAGGADFRAPTFYDAFYAEHGQITTGTGGFDQVWVTRTRESREATSGQRFASFCYYFGVSLFVVSISVVVASSLISAAFSAASSTESA